MPHFFSFMRDNSFIFIYSFLSFPKQCFTLKTDATEASSLSPSLASMVGTTEANNFSLTSMAGTTEASPLLLAVAATTLSLLHMDSRTRTRTSSLTVNLTLRQHRISDQQQQTGSLNKVRTRASSSNFRRHLGGTRAPPSHSPHSRLTSMAGTTEASPLLLAVAATTLSLLHMDSRTKTSSLTVNLALKQHRISSSSRTSNKALYLQILLALVAAAPSPLHTEASPLLLAVAATTLSLLHMDSRTKTSSLTVNLALKQHRISSSSRTSNKALYLQILLALVVAAAPSHLHTEASKTCRICRKVIVTNLSPARATGIRQAHGALLLLLLLLLPPLRS